MSLTALIHQHSYNLDKQANDTDSPLNLYRRSRSSVESRNLVARADKSSSSSSSSSSNTNSEYLPPTSASFYIPSLPGLSPSSTLTLYGGHLPSTDKDSDPDAKNDAHLFFFLAKARHTDKKKKLVIWLNGGPGCSSFDGALMEIGPLRMVQGGKGELVEQPGSWNEYANVLFLDQPAGTGYSYTTSGSRYVHSGKEAAEQIVTFLKNFYDVFPEFAKMDLYLAGESFAGIWIPYLADTLMSTTKISTNLIGLLMGNPWIDPFSQYPAYLDFAVQSKLLSSGSTGYNKVKSKVDKCEKEMNRLGKDKFPINNAVCEQILSSITETTLQVVNGKTLCVNNYDIRLTDEHPACGMNWPNLLPDMYAFLPRKDVVTAFHATSKTSAWVECNGRVSDSFWASTRPSVHLLPSLLSKGLKILFFSGMQDLICNHLGTERMLENITWNGKVGWEGLDREKDMYKKWWVDGQVAGTWTERDNLTYVQVANASHMVPFDVPVVAHDMFTRFTSVDYISAAGSAAQVPSRIGNEEEAIIGETHLNGTALDSAGNYLDDPLFGSGSSSSSSSGSGFNNEVEEVNSLQAPIGDAYYNVGAALLVLLVIAGIGGLFIWRQRRYGGFRRSSILLGSGGKSRDSSSKAESGLAGHLNNHRRTRSSASDRSYRHHHHALARTIGGGADEGDDEERGELLAMEKRGNGGTPTRQHHQQQRHARTHSRSSSNGSIGGRASREQERQHQRQHQQQPLPRGEELFSVGEEEEDEDDEEEEVVSSDEERQREVLGMEPASPSRGGTATRGRYDTYA